jgi:hypothetical protein
MRWAKHVANWKAEECIQDFDRKTLEKITLGKPKRRWVDNNQMNLKEIGMG